MPTRSSLLALLLLAAPLASTPATAQEPERSVTYYDTLSPYGDWVEVDTYGRVWRPHRQVVGEDFIPYASGGRWVHTPSGWAFEARWNWGWLPFHYGRWYEDELNGWVWVPDDVWAPSWVEWRFGGGYVGWVPLGPPRHASARWYFVESRDFAEPEIWEHRATRLDERTVFQATVVIPPPSGIAWSRGPAVEQVRATSRVEIQERKIEPPSPRLPAGVAKFPERLPPVAPAPPRPGSPLATPVARPPQAVGVAPAAAPRPGSPLQPTAVSPAERRPEPVKAASPIPEPTAARSPERRPEPAKAPSPMPEPAAVRPPERRTEPAKAPSPMPEPAAVRPPERRPEPVKAAPPMPERQPPRMQEPARAAPVPPQAMPPTRAPAAEPRPRAEAPGGIREPAQPGQEPFRPMVEQSPRPPAREQQRPVPAIPEGQPGAAPVKRKTPQPPQPQGPPAAPSRGPARGHPS